MFEKFSSLAVDRKAFISCKVGRGSVGAIAASTCAELLESELKDNPYLLVSGNYQGKIPY